MLVLTRHAGERIVIGDGVVITVVATHDKKVRIGIEAPPDVSVDREEIHRRKRQEGEAVSRVQGLRRAQPSGSGVGVQS